MDSEALLAWYDAHRRAMPWREHPEPWRVWVSEVMLQQTQVTAVIPFFDRFLARFPSPESLAAATDEEALTLWSGLGYYRRARHLRAAARRVVEAGGIPRSAAELARLPGIGAYTAAAIASIAFGEVVPVLDGNVVRVMARRLGESGEPTRAAVRRRLLAGAARLLDPRRPGDGNQALMELGATLCAPRAPRCESCPLAGGCRAREEGRTEAYPRARAKAAPRRVRLTVAVVRRRDQLLLVRRPDDAAQLAGLWELPSVRASGRAIAERQLGERWGGTWRLGAVVARLEHAITRHRYLLTARQATWTPEGISECGGKSAWITPDAAGALPLAASARKLLALL